MRNKSRSERNQLELFRALPGDLAPRGTSRPVRSCGSPSQSLSYRSISAPAESLFASERRQSVATIWDADVLIWAASRIFEARNAG